MLIFLSEANIPDNLVQALNDTETRFARGPLHLEELLQNPGPKIVVWVLTPNGVKLVTDLLKILNQYSEVGVVLVKDGIWKVDQWQNQLQTLVQVSDVLEVAEIVQTVDSLKSAGLPEAEQQYGMEFIKLFRRQRESKKHLQPTNIKTNQPIAWDAVELQEKYELSQEYKSKLWWQSLLDNLRKR